MAAEYAYLEEELRKRGEDWDLDHQALLQPDDGRSYDLLKVRLPDGTEREFYFDITESMNELSSSLGKE